MHVVTCFHEEDLPHDLQMLNQLAVLLDLRDEYAACLFLRVQYLLQYALVNELFNGFCLLLEVNEI